LTDHVDRKKRSSIMAAVHSKDTKPEMAVRRLIHGLGYRYRLHVVSLPGCPDLVFPSQGKVVFIHGCFWHRHVRCRYATLPNSNREFWEAKFAANVARDRRTRRELKKMGWQVLIVWQCELRNRTRLTERIDEFLAD
jgi:DNA mismatch endonuclease (patch repair protein)